MIIPARNEQDNLPALFAAIPGQIFRHIIIADNGSTDRTAAIASDHGHTVVCEPHPGYGAACLAALAWIDQQVRQAAMAPPMAVAFLDADLSDDPAKLVDLVEPVLADQADLVIGSRTALAEPGSLDPHQRFGNALACWLLRMTGGGRYGDLGPMRVIRYDALVRLVMTDRTWGWTVEMQFKAARQGLRVLEIDVPYRARNAGVSKISGSLAGSVKAGTKIISTIARLAWSHRHGRDEGESLGVENSQ